LCGASNIDIINIQKDTYEGFSKNWAIDFDNKGTAYIGNEAGLLVFDGLSWEMLKVMGNKTIRSVFVDGSRVYVGSFEEFGYWERGVNGKFFYTSLSEDLTQKQLRNDMIWKIVANGDDEIIFQAFNTLYRYNKQTVEVQEIGYGIIFLLKAKNQIIAQQTKGNLVSYTNNKFTEIPGSEVLHQSFVRVFLPFGDNAYLIGSAKKGLYIWSPEKGFKEWKCNAQAEILEANINSGSFDGENYYIGTLDKGVFVINKNGDIINRIGIAEGLESNSILDTKCDEYGRLWLALNRGISCVSFNKPIQFITSRKQHFGIVQSVAVFNNDFYVATNQGVYYHPISSKNINTLKLEDFKPIDQLKGQAWRLKKINNQLFCTHNRGTFEIKGKDAIKVTNTGGGSNIKPITINGEDYLLENTYTSLVTYKEVDGEYKFNKVLRGFFEPSRNMEIDRQNNIWVSHSRRKEIFKVSVDDIDTPLNKVRYGRRNGLPKNFGNKVCKIDERIVFTSPFGLFTYDELRDSIVRYNKMERYLNEYKLANNVIKSGSTDYWFTLPPKAALFRLESDTLRKVFEYTFSDPFSSLDEKHPEIIDLNDSINIFCLENGFAIFNKQAYNNTTQFPIHLKSVLLRTKKGLKTAFPIGDENRFEYANNNIVFEFMSMASVSAPVDYEYKLEGHNKRWLKANSRNRAYFSNLKWGTYTFKVRGEDAYGKKLLPVNYKFTIRKPYFIKPGFIILSCIICIVFLFIISSLIRKVIKKKRSRLIDKEKNKWDRIHSEEKKEQEEKMVRLKNDLLEKEIQHQSTELANRTIATIKRKEVLNEVRTEIIKQQENLKVSYPEKYMQRIIRMIDRSIEDEDDWTVFRSHFDRAHEDFFKRVKQKYPGLTPKDLRLCAYLKMNLSTKEIAPLMNVSSRSVEVQRYKVRKKLGLDHDENLTEFIILL